MKNKSSFVAFSVVLSFALGVFMFMACERAAIADEVKIVKIIGVAEKGKQLAPTALRLDPQEVKIQKKGIVIWINSADMAEVQVVFQEGKTCKDVVFNANKDFRLDQQSCFVTTYMPYGAVSALTFPQVGKFNYKAVSEDGKLIANGTIDVIEPDK